MYLDEMSVEHLRNVQKIVDKMASDCADLMGSIQAIHLLYGELSNMTEFIDIRQKIQSMYVTPGGQPIANWLAQFSRNLQSTIDKKEKKIA